MLARAPLSQEALLAALRGAGEPTRLRIIVLLGEGDLTVKDLTAILGQSQPRISRHLRLLAEAGLVQRYPEGGWVYYRLAEEGPARRLVHGLVEVIDPADPQIADDRERLAQVRSEHAAVAGRYFAASAADWDAIRSLHAADDAVEKAILAALGDRPFDSLLDLGTGTGRMLELLAPLYSRAVGVDGSTDMLAVARANLARAGISTAQVRLGDLHHLSLPRASFDLVTLHQVLHYLDDPGRAIAEAARFIRPGGRLLVVDFAPHDLEFLRERHAHRRLGLSHESMQQWLDAAGLGIERVEDMVPEASQKLTVTLWLARDPRILIAGGGAGETA